LGRDHDGGESVLSIRARALVGGVCVAVLQVGLARADSTDPAECSNVHASALVKVAGAYRGVVADVCVTPVTAGAELRS
jgi:hypothetical protein